MNSFLVCTVHWNPGSNRAHEQIENPWRNDQLENRANREEANYYGSNGYEP